MPASEPDWHYFLSVLLQGIFAGMVFLWIRQQTLGNPLSFN